MSQSRKLTDTMMTTVGHSDHGSGVSKTTASYGSLEGESYSDTRARVRHLNLSRLFSQMDESREADHLSTKFVAAFEKRQLDASEYNSRLDDLQNPLRPPRRKRIIWEFRAMRSTLPPNATTYAPSGRLTRRQRVKAMEAEWRAVSGRKKASIVWALNDIMEGFWAGGLFKVLGDTCTLMSPLVTKQLIKFSQEGECVRAVVDCG